MDIIGTVLSAADNLAKALQCKELIDKLSIFGYETELCDLQRTVEAITAVLHDAETKQELSGEARLWIEQLKEVVFEADDLLDELVAHAQLQRLVDTDGSLREKVRHFFSSSNPICVSYWMSRGVKDIKKKLDDIAYNSQFSFKLDHEPIRKRRPETCSYVNEVDIVGRDDDLESIVGTLLASNDQRDVSFVTIVGIGGLGKTALAQLVYNDPRVTSAFPSRLWTCVADQDQNELDVKEILCKILASATKKKPDQGFTLDQVQGKLQNEIAGKKFLLVLDDVWNEKREQWCELKKYLNGGERGSWIVVTTRSQETARIIGDDPTHKLEGLSKNNSWCLFKKVAFSPNELSNLLDDDLVDIGRMIVDGCAGVPLAIRVAGSLLFGQQKSKWQSVLKLGLANIWESKNGIMPILKLSFDHLESSLKCCFTYCALFPKDSNMEKQNLIFLWIAQGYIVPFDEGQSIDDAAEEYFSILLKRCFFQDIERGNDGEILICKIHDLMHDVAQSVAGKEIYTTNTICGNIDKKVRHVSIVGSGENGSNFLGKTCIRSHLFASYERPQQFPVAALVVNCRCLRALDLSWLGIKSLPDSIGKLLHLRYLDLSNNSELEVLPNSITKLYNLQTLILRRCEDLKELPKDFSRMVKLRVLDIDKCSEIRYMPRGMNSLQRLVGVYKVGGDERSSRSWLEQRFDGLEGLKDLNNLKGDLRIVFRWTKNNVKSVVNKKDDRKEGIYLCDKEHLNSLYLDFSEDDCMRFMIVDDDERVMIMRLMEELKPHFNLKKLEVRKYCGVRMPGWLTLLSNLVNLSLIDCDELEYLPCLGNLRHLKSLKLSRLWKLEYIEASGSSEDVRVSFPSLEQLELGHLQKLKGWRRRGEEDNSSSNPLLPLLLPCLSQLKIYWCKELVNILICPNLKYLDLFHFNKKLEINIKNKRSRKLGEVGPSSSSSSSEIVKLEDWESSSSSNCDNVVPKLKMLTIGNVAWLLKSAPMESLLRLKRLKITGDDEIEDLPNWMQYCASLHTELKAMPNWMPKLTSLRELWFVLCSISLERRCQKEDPAGEDWPYIQHIPNIGFVCSIADNSQLLQLQVLKCQKPGSVSEFVMLTECCKRTIIWFAVDVKL